LRYRSPTRQSSNPVVQSGSSRGSNRPLLRYCSPAPQFSKLIHSPSARPDGASIQAPDDSAGKTCRNTAHDWRGYEPMSATNHRRSERDVNLAREEAEVATPPNLAANRRRPEIFPKHAISCLRQWTMIRRNDQLGYRPQLVMRPTSIMLRLINPAQGE